MILLFIPRERDAECELEVTWTGRDYIDAECRRVAAEYPAHAPAAAVSLGIGRHEARHTPHSAQVLREQQAARMHE